MNSQPNDSQTDFQGPVCPVPLRDYPEVVLGHGSGGQLTQELIAHLFVPAFGSPELEQLGDAAVLSLAGGQVALATDSFVVQPLFFPGGDIGQLAVHGTINDLAMMGAKPVALAAAFILEEGFSMETLARVVQSMARAAKAAGVSIVTGDTKVVQRGHGDGCYITTTGLGLVRSRVPPAPQRVVPGDAVLLSGTVADHGMAVMSVRQGLEFEAPIRSDTAPLHELVAAMFQACPEIHALRDPTRGGLAAALNEIAQAAGVGIQIDDQAVPVDPVVASACEMLGLDPLAVANEGKLVAFVPQEHASRVLEAMRNHPLGRRAALIGHAVADHPGTVVARTAVGATRVITTQLGEALPRIC